MSIPSLTRSDIGRLGVSNSWVEENRDRLSPEEQEQPFRDLSMPGPVRAILLQNIWGGGTGIATPVSRYLDQFAFKVDISGENVVANSKFKLTVIGVTTGSAPTTSDLFTTAAIPSNSTAEELLDILMAAITSASLPIKRTDIQVLLGNPQSVFNPTLLEPNLQPELDVSNADDIKSYVGSWIIRFTGTFTKNYQTIFASVVQDTTAFMRGLSSVVTQPTRDIPDGAPIVLHDVYNRPADYPWRVGTMCIAIYFMNIGLGIIGSDFRDMTSLPVSEVPPVPPTP